MAKPVGTSSSALSNSSLVIRAVVRPRQWNFQSTTTTPTNPTSVVTPKPTIPIQNLNSVFTNQPFIHRDFFGNGNARARYPSRIPSMINGVHAISDYKRYRDLYARYPITRKTALSPTCHSCRDIGVCCFSSVCDRICSNSAFIKAITWSESQTTGSTSYKPRFWRTFLLILQRVGEPRCSCVIWIPTLKAQQLQTQLCDSISTTQENLLLSCQRKTSTTG